MTTSRSPLTLNDELVRRILNNAAVTEAFSALGEYQKQLASQPPKKGCGCGQKDKAAVATPAALARRYILGLPQEQLERLKTLAGFPGRTIRAYQTVNGVSKRVSR